MKVKLSDLYDIGSSKRVFQSEWRESGVPFYRAREIAKLSDDGFVDNELFIDEELYSQYTEKYGKPEAGDVMVTGVGTLGVCYVVKPEDRFYFKDGNILWFRQKAKDKILPEYLVKVFDSKEVKDFIAKNSSGTTVGTFTIQTAKKMEISLPSLDEQKKIIDKIIRTESIIKQRKKELQLLDTLIKARFVELFGDMTLARNDWEKVLLCDVCDVRDGTHDSPKYFTEGYPLITSKNVSGGKIDFSDCNLICEEDYNKINQRSKVDVGDILMPMIGTVGKPVIVDSQKKFAIKNVALIKFRENSAVVNSFIKELLESDYFDREVINKVRGGTQKFISLGDIRKLNICLPPIKLQNQFAAFVNEIDKSKLKKFSAA